MAAPVPIRRAKTLSPEGFRARVARCRMELDPVIGRLSRRHGVEVIWAALLTEIEEGAIALNAGGRMNEKALADLIERLQAHARAGSVRKTDRSDIVL